MFNSLITAPWTASNTHAQVARELHVQQVVRCLVRRDSSAINFDRTEIAFYFSFILLAELLTDLV